MNGLDGQVEDLCDARSGPSAGLLDEVRKRGAFIQ